MIGPILASISDDEMEFIASLDYGQDKDKHLEALRSLIFEQKGELREGQLWFPHEVIALGSNSLKPGHERTFAICTLLVIAAGGAECLSGSLLASVR
jgi:hypothetical protein